MCSYYRIIAGRVVGEVRRMYRPHWDLDELLAPRDSPEPPPRVMEIMAARPGSSPLIPARLSKTIAITVKGDKKRESNEVFFVDLLGISSNSLFTENGGLGTILNDE